MKTSKKLIILFAVAVLTILVVLFLTGNLIPIVNSALMWLQTMFGIPEGKVFQISGAGSLTFGS